MTARVAIDLALDRLWTYSVPEEMEKKHEVRLFISNIRNRLYTQFLKSVI